VIHLLSTQILLDAVAGRASILAWLNTASLTDIEASAVSIGQARDAISRLPASRRRSLETGLDRFIDTLDIHQGIIAFDRAAGEMWAQLMGIHLPYSRPDGTATALSAPSRMVVATALSRGAVLVESTQPYHSHIIALRTLSP
jgi:hypothetical protein